MHIGCGVGYYTAIIAEVVGPNGGVIGVEIDPCTWLCARVITWPTSVTSRCWRQVVVTTIPAQ